MGNESRASQVCTPPLTPITNAKSENETRDNSHSIEGGANAKYTLKPATRAYASTARLNLQHYLWKDHTGYLLHPSIPLSGTENLKIADVGTGTGIFLLDLARTLPPTTQLDGFDIDISDCPPSQWLPQNVTMRHLDALGDIPSHLAGVYDIVQLRLFQVVVKDNDPGPLLRNMLRMLKPGGYLQWAEYDMTTQTTIKACADLSTVALDAIPAFVQGFKKNDGRVGVQDWIPRLPTTFSTHGLTRTTSSRHPTTNPFLPYQLDVFLLTYDELAAKTFDSLPGDHGARLRELIEAASAEGRKGVGWGMDRLVVVGRKAEAGAEVDRPLSAAGISEDGKGGEVEANVGIEGDGEESGSRPDVPRSGMREKRTSRRENWLRIWKRLGSS